MAVPAIAIAGGAAAAAYLDAKLHVRHDLAAGVLTDPVARAQEYVAQRQGQRRMLIYHLLEDNVLSSRSGNLFLEYEGRSWTYKQFYDSVQRVGNWLMNDIGVRQGEMVALNGLNSAEYLFLWFALEGIGARIAFTNCHLTGNPLVHSVKVGGDKFYTCLPLYHGAGQGLCILPVVYSGASVRVGRRFSHKTFWPEVCESKANRLQYVGELCRYLVNAPPHPLERKHNVQEAWGNGMRPDVWNTFRQRFNITAIHELYAATDGMGSSFNRNLGDFSSGAIGVRGYLWHMKRGANEVRAKIDPDTEDIVRASNGFVIRANVGEPGEVLHRVDPAMAESAFKGYYNNPGASHKRWLRGVFEPDDLFFRSGDVMRVDADGRVYFVDRLGDTFRWKSENVSTNEVADILGQFDQIAECNVYGVSVPHADGRCGCATIVPTTSTSLDSFDFARLYTHVAGRLPRYAVPLFLRVAPELSYTGTFKIQKGQAKREGVDLDLIEQAGSKDRLYWLPPGGSAYVPFRREDWQALKAGDFKL
ncbi:hypothetical protein B0A55_11437 [Friedmanniomyces simplex]|uniref:AMP-dependent synthetase/ligase domain-containing protein n=1 Tax=Friedmanniomyces simplex TaxID=329884 RepID=A0A4U0WBX8_9PEZI|nr:hypothetical protein B0A55_11437 [Friedmanniomyces simplex]